MTFVFFHCPLCGPTVTVPDRCHIDPAHGSVTAACPSCNSQVTRIVDQSTLATLALLGATTPITDIEADRFTRLLDDVDVLVPVMQATAGKPQDRP